MDFNIGKALGAGANALGRDTAKLGEGVGNAFNEMGKEIAEDFGEVERRYNEEGFMAGTAELIDAMSPGTFVANGLDAVGLVEDEAGKNLVSSMINVGIACVGPQGLVLAPGAIVSTINDISQISADLGAKSAQGTKTPEAMLPPAAAESLRGIRTAKPGYANAGTRCQSPVQLPVMRPGYKVIDTRDMVNSMNPLPPATGPSVADRPVRDTGIADILNDKTLCFEDMLALVMMKICQEQENEIMSKIEEIEATFGSADAATDKVQGEAQGKAQGSTPAADESGRSAESSQAGAGAGPSAKAEVEGGPFGDIVNMLGGAETCGGMLKTAGDFTTVMTPAISAAIIAVAGPALAATGVGAPVTALLPIVVPLLVAGAGMGMSKGGEALAESNVGKPKSAPQRQTQATAQGQPQGALHEQTQAQQAEGAVPGQEPGTTEKKQEPSQQRAMMMEKLKMLNQRMSQMQQALSNILNTQHQTAMNTIRNIK